MERVENYKYLEVWIAPNLSWSKHISEACCKARQKVGILYRKCYKNANNASYNAKNILKKVLKLCLSCIRPELEYAATVWSPHQKGRIDTLESVQYEFEFRLQISVAYSYFCNVLTTSQILVMDLHSTEEIAMLFTGCRCMLCNLIVLQSEWTAGPAGTKPKGRFRNSVACS